MQNRKANIGDALLSELLNVLSNELKISLINLTYPLEFTL